jgi:hypothetical protein
MKYLYLEYTDNKGNLEPTGVFFSRDRMAPSQSPSSTGPTSTPEAQKRSVCFDVSKRRKRTAAAAARHR